MTPAAQLKTCCAAAYESSFARMLLGDSFHPGGLSLTLHLGELLALRPGARVLDVASGKGESAIGLARRFGCEVVGVDFGAGNVADATARAADADMAHLVSFRQGDAEQLEFADGSFDAVICECAFCTFPGKPAAARQFARVLRGGGRLGLSDLTRSGPLPADLTGLLAWIACIADARPVAEYTDYLKGAGFDVTVVESHDRVLAEMVRDIQGKLMAVELMGGVNKLDLAGIDLDQAKRFAKSAAAAIRGSLLGYSLIVAQRP
ncbi:MAG TPA: methyltransferase domain-containing protein [Bryobacteraceae bacterium]|jgi:SAM-dependent methyltransferase|nr:methyltransferase domain-containing protein [Bryobacteraceae bacterium]